MPEKSRIQKILAAYGVASRRQAEELLRAGRVTVNGRPAGLGDSAVPGKEGRSAAAGQRSARTSENEKSFSASPSLRTV